MDNRPIGIFDSGMGGLSVRAEIARRLPRESLVYFGDGANVPYGPRSKEDIIRLVEQGVVRLLDRGVKMVVIACNAATGAAIDHLRARYAVPFVGMEPAVKPAALTTETGIIGVLATKAALEGTLYRNTAAGYSEGVRIVEMVGEGFVELVEGDLEDSQQALDTVRKALAPMLEAGADRIVLGCTHYPFLERQIAKIVREHAAKTGTPPARVIDSGEAIARRIERLLTENELNASPDHSPTHEFLTAADEEYLRRLTDKNSKISIQ